MSRLALNLGPGINVQSINQIKLSTNYFRNITHIIKQRVQFLCCENLEAADILATE